MDLRSLRYFLAVADELHFGRAARQLHISQPPLSRQVSNLERELGVTLLYRTKRRVELTPAGKLFAQDVRPVLRSIEEATENVKRAGKGEIGRLAIGFFIGATYTVLPEVMRRFRAQNPAVRIDLREMAVTEVADALSSGAIDVGFLRPPSPDPALVTHVLLREPFVAAVPEESEYAKAEELDLKQLADAPFIMFAPGPSVLYGQIMAACHKAGFHPKIVQEARHPETLIGLVRSGAGIALVASSVQMRGGVGVRFMKITGPLPKAEIAVAWRRKNVSPLLKSFLDHARMTRVRHFSAKVARE